MDDLPQGQSTSATAAVVGDEAAHTAAPAEPWLILAGAVAAMAGLYAASRPAWPSTDRTAA